MTIENSVSVLVPVYNISKYIGQCIESILNQTYSKWELILVDDGSTDESPLICDNYANIDRRIKTIHKANGGLASARNVGLNAATGDWIMMLDGDDWLSINALELCISVAQKENADFVKFSYCLEYAQRTVKCQYPILASKEKYIESLLDRSIATSIWGGLYRNSLFEKLNPKFLNGLDFGEDYSVTPRLLHKAQKAIFIQDCLYHYRVLNSGYVGSCKWRNIQQLIKCEEVIYGYFSKIENCTYIKALNMGHAWIKVFAFKYIIADYEKNGTNIEYIKKLYKGSLDYSKIGLLQHLFVLMASNSFFAKKFAILYGAEKKIMSIARKTIGMSRG